MLVRDVMTEVQTTLNPYQKVSEAWVLIFDLDVTGLPVVDINKNIIGILTKDDIMTLGARYFNEQKDFNNTDNPFDQKVESVIQDDILIIQEDMQLERIIALDYEVFPVVNKQGKITGTLDKNQIKHHLFKEASNMLLQMDTIIDSTHNGIVAIDEDGFITIFNAAAEKITRRTKKEAIGNPLSEILIPQGLLEVLKKGESQLEHKFSIEYSAGKHIYLTSRSPIIENGKVMGAVGIFQDISEIEFISEELDSVKQLNNELKCIIESSYDGILITDIYEKIIKANQAHERITKLHSEKIQGLNFEELIKKGIYSKSIVKEVLNKKKPVTHMEQTPSHNHLLITGNPVRNKSGKIFRVVINIRDITELNQLREELEASRELSERYHTELTQLRGKIMRQEGLVFNSPKMQDLIDMALRVARVDSTILIFGESGVGKEVIAKIIHNNSKRREESFIPVNCATIPENLLESELFGYEKGAFTGANKEGKPGIFELAHNGTIFLDEIGEIPQSFQVKLLRVIQEREVLRVGGTKPRSINVRILVATNKNLETQMQQGKFREDLYFRLNVVPLYIPPLRERKEEIIPLIYTFKKKFTNQYTIEKEISPEVIDIFLNHDWPGNVRELENIIERLLVTAPGSTITSKNMPSQFINNNTSYAPQVSIQGILPLKVAVMELERQLIATALKDYGSTYKVARILQVDQSTIVRKIKNLRKKGLDI